VSVVLDGHGVVLTSGADCVGIVHVETVAADDGIEQPRPRPT
jgi:hypothetical protein